jgi:hypothetical protein
LIRLGLTQESADTAHFLSLADDFELVSLAPITLGTQCYMLSDAGGGYCWRAPPYGRYRSISIWIEPRCTE